MFEQGKAGSAKLRDLTSYIEDTWITGLWKPKHWSVFKQSVRTNNDVEGWHNCLNRQARRGQLPFYLLVALLHKKSQMVSVQVRLLSEANLRRYQRAKYSVLQGRIFSLWDAYLEGKKKHLTCCGLVLTSMDL